MSRIRRTLACSARGFCWLLLALFPLVLPASPQVSRHTEPNITVEKTNQGYTVNFENAVSMDDLREFDQWVNDPIPSVAEDVASVSDDQSDIALTQLLLEKEYDRTVNIRASLAQIDAMAAEVKKIAGESKDPKRRIAAINEYLYDRLKISYDFSDPKATKRKNRFLSGLLKSREGSCVTMPILYMAIAQRLGYPIFPVLIPHHAFLRYVDLNGQNINIEATSGGGVISDDEYRLLHPTSDKGIDSGSYFRTLTYRQYIGAMLGEMAFLWGSEGRGDLRRAVKYLNYSIRMNNLNPPAFRLRAEAWEKLATFAPESYRKYLTANALVDRRIAEDRGLNWNEVPDDYIARNAKKLFYYRSLKNEFAKSREVKP